MTEFKTQKTYSKVKENEHLTRQETTHFKSKSREIVYLGKKERAVNAVPKKIKRSGFSQQYYIKHNQSNKNNLNIAKKDIDEDEEQHEKRKARAVKRYLNQGKNKVYFHSTTKGVQFGHLNEKTQTGKSTKPKPIIIAKEDLQKERNKKAMYQRFRHINTPADEDIEEAAEDNVAVDTIHKSSEYAKSVVYLNERRRKNTANKKYYFRGKTESTLKDTLEDKKIGEKLYSKQYSFNRGKQSSSLFFDKKKSEDSKELKKQKLKKQFQKKNQVTLFKRQEEQQKKKNIIKFIFEELKKLIIRNSLIMSILSLLSILLLICTGIVMTVLIFLSVFTMITYPAEHEELDQICNYIEEQDAAYIDMFEHMGDNFYRYTLTYEGTGVINTNKRHMISYLTANLMDEVTFAKTQSTIDWFYPLLYPYEAWTVWEQISTNPDRFVKHLYVVVTCKSVEQIIEEERLLQDETKRAYYNLLNRTGGLYFDPQYASPFPEDKWSENITSGYGWRNHPITGNISFHDGIDIAYPEGTNIATIYSGTVVDIGEDRIYGKYITVQNGNVKTMYAHCSSTLANRGDKVEEGDVIAFVGSTGQSTGPHLHITIWIDGEIVDPTEYLSTSTE